MASWGSILWLIVVVGLAVASLHLKNRLKNPKKR